MAPGDRAEHHTDREYAEERMYGDRIAHGFLVFSVGTGLRSQTGVLARTLGAVTEVTVSSPNATYGGDTVSGQFEVAGRSDAPFGSTGLVSTEGELANQHGTVVCHTEADLLIERRDGSGDG